MVDESAGRQGGISQPAGGWVLVGNGDRELVREPYRAKAAPRIVVPDAARSLALLEETEREMRASAHVWTGNRRRG